MWTRTRVVLAISTTLCSGFLGFLPPLRSAAEAQANVTGQWSTKHYMMPINPIHVGLLRTGKLLVVAGSENDLTRWNARSYTAAVWDLQAETIAVQNLTWDVFCNGMAFLPDGRALIIGGTERYDPFWGSPEATIFDPVTETFIQAESMAHGRWYATATTLSDGSILAFSGLDKLGAMNRTIEIYRAGMGWSLEQSAPWIPPFYPWLHLLPNGRLFYSGSTPQSHVYDPSNPTNPWTLNVATTTTGINRTNGASVLLPLLPQDGYKPRVMIMGGGYPGTETAEIIDLSEATPKWLPLPSMSRRRVYHNAVLLPNGKVMVSGGNTLLGADLFDPVSKTWSSAGTPAYYRTYHSVGLLLPDATVMTAGSNPNRGVYEKRIEIWTPPYLFTTDASGNVVPAARPTITAAPARIGYGLASSFQVQSPNAADIRSVVLMRNGSTTHAFDMDSRMVGLTIKTVAGTTLTVSMPPNAHTAPPGYYMLFLLNSRGVPSIARFVQVSPANELPLAIPGGPYSGIATKPIQFNAGGSSDPDGTIASYQWTFGDNTPTGSGVSPTHTYASPGGYTVSLRVTDNEGASRSANTTVNVVPLPTSPTPTAPTAPTGLDWTVSNGRARLSWTDNSSNESGFRIELSTNGVDFPVIATNVADDTTYSRPIERNRSYYFRVRAFNSVGNSAYSNTVTVRR